MPLLPSVASPTGARLRILDATLASDPQLWRILAPVPDEYFRDATSVADFAMTVAAEADAQIDAPELETRLARILDQLSPTGGKP